MRLRFALLALLPFLGSQDRPIALHLAGDSTMAEKRPAKRPETGWGEHLQAAFDSTRVRVVNHAQNGRSTRTFIAEGRWQAIVDSLRAGDWVFIQFGHNDQSRDKPDRYTPPDDFRGNLERMVREARAKGATPVLLTPVMRRRFDSTGKFYDTHREYPDLARRVAAELGVPLLDMHRASERVLREYGPERSRSLFLQLKPGEHPNYPQGVDDNTHFNPAGALVMAQLAVQGIRALGLDLARHLTAPSATAATADAPGARTTTPVASCGASLAEAGRMIPTTIALHVAPARRDDRLQRPWADTLLARIAAELRLPDTFAFRLLGHGERRAADSAVGAGPLIAGAAFTTNVRVAAAEDGAPLATLLTTSLDVPLDNALTGAVMRALARGDAPRKAARIPLVVSLITLPLPSERTERDLDWLRKGERENRRLVQPVAERAVPHVRLGSRPRLLPYSPKPRYPDALRKRGRTGEVWIHGIVAPEGRLVPESVVVLEATHPEFEAAVRDILHSLRFDAAIAEGGCAYPTPVQQPFYFRLAR